MQRDVYELQGYAIVLDKVVHVSRVFVGRKDEGFQFNIGLTGDVRLSMKFTDRAEATLQRDLFLQALRGDG